MMKLNIVYGAEREVWYVQNAVKKIPWYVENGYPIESVKLPNGVTKDSSDEEIVRTVNSEYADTDYVECAEKLQEEWKTISAGFEKMRSESSFHISDTYEVVLTKYGTGGNYNVDKSRVTVRINDKSRGGTVGIVAHEIVHMTIQYLIDQYHVRHWRKERLVDLLTEHYFPGLKKMQNIKDDVGVVDQAFEKHFPDMEAIAQSIGD
ncbi:MAG: hypothetical protein V1685_05730 [Parcubacteria group bacterium]